jgi:hypothetical protein
MPTKIYETTEIELVDGTKLEIGPLKIKYLRQFMEYFNLINDSMNDEQSLVVLTKCVAVSMKQYYPSLATVEKVEDNIDLPTIYKIIEYCAGIKMNKVDETNSNPQPKQQPRDKDDSWEKLDLVKLESELFVLGAWKNFDEIETNLSMPELMAILESIRELDYNEKKFLAAMQGVDLDNASGKNDEVDPWEAMKARVASNGATSDPNDIISYQGERAAKAGFGIGFGLDYEVVSQ